MDRTWLMNVGLKEYDAMSWVMILGLENWRWVMIWAWIWCRCLRVLEEWISEMNWGSLMVLILDLAGGRLVVFEKSLLSDDGFIV